MSKAGVPKTTYKLTDGKNDVVVPLDTTKKGTLNLAGSGTPAVCGTNVGVHTPNLKNTIGSFVLLLHSQVLHSIKVLPVMLISVLVLNSLVVFAKSGLLVVKLPLSSLLVLFLEVKFLLLGELLLLVSTSLFTFLILLPGLLLLLLQVVD